MCLQLPLFGVVLGACFVFGRILSRCLARTIFMLSLTRVRHYLRLNVWECAYAWTWMSVRVCVRARARAHAHAHERACMCMCVCERERASACLGAFIFAYQCVNSLSTDTKHGVNSVRNEDSWSERAGQGQLRRRCSRRWARGGIRHVDARRIR